MCVNKIVFILVGHLWILALVFKCALCREMQKQLHVLFFFFQASRQATQASYRFGASGKSVALVQLESLKILLRGCILYVSLFEALLFFIPQFWITSASECIQHDRIT